MSSWCAVSRPPYPLPHYARLHRCQWRLPSSQLRSLCPQKRHSSPPNDLRLPPPPPRARPTRIPTRTLTTVVQRPLRLDHLPRQIPTDFLHNLLRRNERRSPRAALRLRPAWDQTRRKVRRLSYQRARRRKSSSQSPQGKETRELRLATLDDASSANPTQPILLPCALPSLSPTSSLPPLPQQQQSSSRRPTPIRTEASMAPNWT